MARIYSTQTANIIETGPGPVTLEPDVVWLDLLNPTTEEEKGYEAQLGIDLPMREELKSIEPSSRLYREDGALYMTATVVSHTSTDLPEATAIGFILHQQRLITIRYSEPRAFRNFGDYLSRHREEYLEGPYILCSLLEAIVDRAAEVMENITMEIDGISERIFTERAAAGKTVTSGEDLSVALKQISYRQNLMGKIRDSLVSLGRVVRFLGLFESITRNETLREQLRSIDRDIESLTDQASFLSGNITFLLEASLGLISIQQNTIIKIFSVAAVTFLPPTLIASIYGMNFEFIPEMHMKHGYHFALLLMVMSAVGPYLWFKHKRWL